MSREAQKLFFLAIQFSKSELVVSKKSGSSEIQTSRQHIFLPKKSFFWPAVFLQRQDSLVEATGIEPATF